MKKTLCTGLALLLIHFLAQAQAYRDTLVYAPSRQLTWDVFQSTAPDEVSAKAELPEVVALQALPTIQPFHKVEVATDLLMGFRQVNVWTGISKFWVTAVVYKDRCWVHPDHATEEALAHAQLHFEIAGIFARRLEADINAQRINANNRQKIERVFTAYHHQMRQEQQRLDQETHGGHDPQKQREWEKKIRLMLTSLPDEAEEFSPVGRR